MFQLKSMMENMSSREQGMVFILMFLVLALVIHSLVISPLHEYKEQAMRQALAAEDEWRWLSKKIEENPIVKKQVAVKKYQFQELTELLANQAKGFDYKITSSAKSLKVKFSSVEANGLFSLIAHIEKTGGVISSARISPVGDGLVNAHIEVAR